MRRIVWALFALTLLVATVGECVAGGESLTRFRRDGDFLEKGRFQAILWVNPLAPDTNAVVSGVMLDSCSTGTHTFTAAQIAALHGSGTTFQRGSAGMARTVSCNIAAWDYASTANDIAAGTVKVNGYNLLGESISETFTITANTENSQQGSVAFASLTNFQYTAQDDDSVGVSIGIGTKLGLWNTLASDYMVVATNGTSEDASAAITPDVDEIEKNVIDYNSDPNGTTDHSVIYWVSPWAATTATDRY
jgi:hypothetical protein